MITPFQRVVADTKLNEKWVKEIIEKKSGLILLSLPYVSRENVF